MGGSILIQNHILLHHRSFYIGIDEQKNAEDLLPKTSRAVVDIAEALQYFSLASLYVFGAMTSLLPLHLLVKLDSQYKRRYNLL